MVGILASFWEGPFSGAMLVLGSVYLRKLIIIVFGQFGSFGICSTSLTGHTSSPVPGGGIVTSASKIHEEIGVVTLYGPGNTISSSASMKGRKALRVLGQDFLPQIFSDKMALLQKRWQRCNELSFWL